MNLRSLFISIILLSIAVSTAPASALNSQFANWANKAIVSHVKEGSKALAADLKGVGNAVAGASKDFAQEAFKTAQFGINKYIQGANNFIDFCPPVAIWFGLWGTAFATGIAYGIHDECTKRQVQELSDLSYLITSSPSVQQLQAVKIDQFSASVQDAFSMFMALADSYQIKAYTLARLRLYEAIRADIEQFQNPIIPALVGITGLAGMATIAAYKTGLADKIGQFAQKSLGF